MDMPVLPTNERRKQRRRKFDHEVVIEIGDRRGTARVKDFSESGLFVATDLNLPEGSAVTITDPESGISALAGVRRVDTSGFGLEFDDETIGRLVAGWGGNPLGQRSGE